MRPRLLHEQLRRKPWYRVHPERSRRRYLDLMRAALAGGQYRGGIRLNSNYLDIRVLILQVLAGAGYGAAGAYACNEDVNLVAGLLPDLGAGGCVVCSWVCRVYELTRDEAVRVSLASSFAFAIAPDMPFVPSVRTSSAP